MAARTFQDLVCWQLAEQLKLEVLAFTAHDRVARDFKYCAQMRDAAASATRNISEGFGRFTAGEFAQYLKCGHAPH